MSEIRQAFDDGWRLGVAYADRFCDLPGIDTDEHCAIARDAAWQGLQDAFTAGVVASEQLEAQTSARVGGSTGTVKPTEGVTAGETAQQEIERVRESAGRTIGELREEIADLKGVIASLQRAVTRLTVGQETCPHGNDPELCMDEACYLRSKA